MDDAIKEIYEPGDPPDEVNEILRKWAADTAVSCLQEYFKLAEEEAFIHGDHIGLYYTLPDMLIDTPYLSLKKLVAAQISDHETDEDLGETRDALRACLDLLDTELAKRRKEAADESPI